ncbi:MAG TPA: TraB/GumN family protein, partial [Dongiaceae bacterium]|nr:TraB/GumN family protein [Dongiaceae bacterium]
LPSDARAKLDEAAKAMGLRSAMLEPLRPWMAALTITVAPLMRAGYDPGMGIDKSLEGDAERAHKSVRTFETPEQQILLFANLPEETELKFFLQTLDETAAAPKMVDQMADAWLDGDLEALDSLVFDKMKQGAPELYDIMIVERNRDWSKQIATLMKGAGTSFIAVGAGHLTGDNSVQALLAQQGFDVARY